MFFLGRYVLYIVPFFYTCSYSPRFLSLFLVQSDGSEVTAEALEGKVLAVYFSASWCAPCKQFTPILKSVYNQLQKAGEKKHTTLQLFMYHAFVLTQRFTRRCLFVA